MTKSFSNRNRKIFPEVLEKAIDSTVGIGFAKAGKVGLYAYLALEKEDGGVEAVRYVEVLVFLG